MRVHILITKKAYESLRRFTQESGHDMEAVKPKYIFANHVGVSLSSETFCRAQAMRNEGETISDLLIRITRRA